MSWEEAVRHWRTIPKEVQNVRDAYLDEDNLEAARRFEASDEFREVLSLLQGTCKRMSPWDVLDIGAGNGIASYAFAKAGNKVYALEPDSSNDVGTGAIRRLKEDFFLNIEIFGSAAEKIPLPEQAVDVVYVRQALHHSYDLEKVLSEVHRVLRDGGCLLACREHVVDNDEQLKTFLDSHPLHKWYGGENALSLQVYMKSIQQSGLKIVNAFGPYDSVINVAPMSMEEMKGSLAMSTGLTWVNKFFVKLFEIEKIWFLCAWVLSRVSKTPGRLYSFLALKEGIEKR
jgi:ubiquinone/menaquinone biosynthesis C-methylase UbiE